MSKKVSRLLLVKIVLILLAVAIVCWAFLIQRAISTAALKKKRIDDLSTYLSDLKLEKERLSVLIKSKQEELEIVERNFQQAYNFVRIIIVLLWLLIIWLYWYFNEVGIIRSCLDISGILSFLLVILNFLAFDRVLDFKVLLGELKELIKNILFSHSFEIKEEVYQYTSSLDALVLRIDEIEREIEEIQTEK